MILLLPLIFTWAQSQCENSPAAPEKMLGKSHSSAVWMETTQDDGKPLFIQLKEKDKKLYLVFVKSKEGLWAEGPAVLCRNEKSEVHAKISRHDIQLGKALPMLIRFGFSMGADFLLIPQGNKAQPELKIAITGWSGNFVPSTIQSMTKSLEP